MAETNAGARTRQAAQFNSFQLKALACTVMLIDHIGAVFFPKLYLLRVIGRLAFPLFAWMISNGYQHTSDRVKYMTRLFIFALISQWPFALTFHRPFFADLNIYVTLLLGLVAIHAYEVTGAGQWKTAIPVLIGILAELLNTDYGLYGVLTIVLFYIYRDDFAALVKWQVLINLAFVLPALLSVLGQGLTALLPAIQAASLLSLFLIQRYNGELGPKIKYAFYWFYPGHLLVLYLIWRVVR